MRTTVPECIQALRKATDEVGHSPSRAEYDSLDITPVSGTIMRVMGGWNKAKEEAGLETNPASRSRLQPKPDSVSLPPDMEWENLTVDQRWHYQNVERNGRATLARRAQLRLWVYGLKKDSDGCERCREDDPACLEYHHLDTEEKTMSVSSLINNEPSKERLMEEIEKCELVCANCHRKEHYQVPRPFG